MHVAMRRRFRFHEIAEQLPVVHHKAQVAANFVEEELRASMPRAHAFIKVEVGGNYVLCFLR